jgi:hydrogenase small subunit
MAITRREFVTRLGALAAAMGVSQVDLAKMTEAFAHTGGLWTTGWADKPKVIWVHGAECTGCSTSLLSLFEDVRGKAIEGASYTTLAALDLAVGGSGTGGTVLGTTPSAGHPFGHRTVVNSEAVTDCDFDNRTDGDGIYMANIADVLIDFIDLQYHETVMGPAGDLAYQWLKDNMAGSSTAFVLVVEGAIQPKELTGAWGKAGDAKWCAIGMDGATGAEASFDDVVYQLGIQANCKAIVAIGQCATFGGYPACVSPEFGASQTGAMGTYDFFNYKGHAAKNKVVNVPGCPTNPWWFILSVVAWLVDATAVIKSGFTAAGPLGILASDLSIKTTAVDKNRRLKAVYGTPLHGKYCSRYQSFLNNQFAEFPGDAGCLQLLGCKGPSTKTLCGPHGWNSQQPQNDSAWEQSLAALQGGKGGNCIAGGAPCMGCTEKGYPDAFLPFIGR